MASTSAADVSALETVRLSPQPPELLGAAHTAPFHPASGDPPGPLLLRLPVRDPHHVKPALVL